MPSGGVRERVALFSSGDLSEPLSRILHLLEFLGLDMLDIPQAIHDEIQQILLLSIGILYAAIESLVAQLSAQRTELAADQIPSCPWRRALGIPFAGPTLSGILLAGFHEISLTPTQDWPGEEPKSQIGSWMSRFGVKFTQDSWNGTCSNSSEWRGSARLPPTKA
jgi:hypothetical protein